MEHRTTPDFWEEYNRLDHSIQRVAEKNYQLHCADPKHPSLHFKELRDDIWSVRVGRKHRALALLEDGMCTWFWIGSHAEYDKLISE